MPLFLDACRFAENAWFIKSARRATATRPWPDIVREMAALADGMTMSREEGPAGQHRRLAGRSTTTRWPSECRNLLILTEGFPTYGGLAGRDLEALAQGLARWWTRTTCATASAPPRTSARRSTSPASRWSCPSGGHAVYIDARALLPHIPPLEYPGQALAVALYRAGGIRGCEIGTVMFGRRPDGIGGARGDGPRAAGHPAPHLHAVAHRLRDRGLPGAWPHGSDELRGLRIADEPPRLRHFTARFEPL